MGHAGNNFRFLAVSSLSGISFLPVDADTGLSGAAPKPVPLSAFLVRRFDRPQAASVFAIKDAYKHQYIAI